MWYISIVVLQPWHFSKARCLGGTSFNNELLLRFSVPLFRFDKSAYRSVHGVWTLQVVPFTAEGNILMTQRGQDNEPDRFVDATPDSSSDSAPSTD